MGREASCRCRWGAEEAEVEVLLETDELLLRGGMRRRIPFSEIHEVKAGEESLSFRVGPDRVALELGKQAADRWAKAIVDPPTLAKKLGISHRKHVKILGSLQEGALTEALASASRGSGVETELIFFLVQTPEELSDCLERSEPEMVSGTSVWVVYPKGKGKPLSESQVRTALRARGMVDTKVASVSETLTGLRFSHRKRRPNLATLPSN